MVKNIKNKLQMGNFESKEKKETDLERLLQSLNLEADTLCSSLVDLKALNHKLISSIEEPVEKCPIAPSQGLISDLIRVLERFQALNVEVRSEIKQLQEKI